MDLGVAGTIAIKTITTAYLDEAVNEWLEANGGNVVLQIISNAFGSIPSVTIVYRKY